MEGKLVLRIVQKAMPNICMVIGRKGACRGFPAQYQRAPNYDFVGWDRLLRCILSTQELVGECGLFF